jgi:type I restriction enzyme S subunit
MSPYPSYKDSGVEWIGEIPREWTMKPLYSHFSHNRDKNDGSIDTVLSLSYGRLIKRDVERNFGLLPESFESYQLLQGGDIILRMTDLQNDKRSLRVGFCEFQGIITSVYIGLRPDNTIHSRYYYSYLHFCDLKKVFYGLGGGIRQSVTYNDFKRFPLPIPPLPEQQKISNYLDQKTKQINDLIEKTEQKIELLKEKRTSLVNHCVTKGLDPNVKMKDSGVEWIGEIPNKWVMTRLKFVGDVIIGLSYKPDNIVEEHNGTLVMRSSNVQDGKSSFLDNVYVNTTIPEKLRTREGDILICSRNGSRKLIGKNCVITKDIEGMTFGVFMTVFRSQYWRFIYWVLNSPIFKSQSGLYLTSTINQLTVSTLKSFVIPFTKDPQEQQQIVTHLDTETQKIDTLIEKENKRIDLLKEYRQSLISEVVTGKIDVRDEVLQ